MFWRLAAAGGVGFRGSARENARRLAELSGRPERRFSDALQRPCRRAAEAMFGVFSIKSRPASRLRSITPRSGDKILQRLANDPVALLLLPTGNVDRFELALFD
jgi:hypothetical protein